ncbi:MAG: hypothetical protein ACE5EK_00635 [Nitrospinales bacterium]
MILGWEDIAGGSTFLALFIWVFLTGLFYLVLYLAVVNVTDQKTGNSPVKFPVMLCLSAPGAFFISLFSYNPLILCFLMAVSNYFRTRNLTPLEKGPWQGQPPNKLLYILSSYGYIAALYGLGAWFQHPVDVDGVMQPYWKTWFPVIPH